MGCGSDLPIASITQVYVASDVLTPSGTFSSISSSFWNQSMFPFSPNIPLWHDPFAIAWQDSDISTLTIWTPEGGPKGAVLTLADTAILSSYTLQFTTYSSNSYSYSSNSFPTGLITPASTKAGIIAGLTFGIVFGLMLLAVGVWLFLKRAKRAREERRPPQIIEVEAVTPFHRRQH